MRLHEGGRAQDRRAAPGRLRALHARAATRGALAGKQGRFRSLPVRRLSGLGVGALALMLTLVVAAEVPAAPPAAPLRRQRRLLMPLARAR